MMSELGNGRELSVKQIAEELGVTERTVYYHIVKTGKQPSGTITDKYGNHIKTYQFVSKEAWMAEANMATAIKMARMMPEIGKLQFAEGFTSLFGSPEQKAVLEAYKNGILAAVGKAMEIAADKVVEARVETEDTKLIGINVVAARIDLQERADQYLIAQAMLWDMLEYMIEDAGILDGRQFDHVFKKFLKERAKPANVNIDRPDKQQVQFAKARFETARQDGSLDNEELHRKQGQREMGADEDDDVLTHGEHTQEEIAEMARAKMNARIAEITAEVNEEFKDLIKPIALVVAYNSKGDTDA